MKHLKIFTLYFIIILAIFGLNACQEKSAKELRFVSNDEQLTLTVNGKKSSSLDPWQVELAIQFKSNKKEPLVFEFFNEDITDNNVKVEWLGAHNGQIQFLQQDGSARKLDFMADDSGVAIREVN